MKQRKNGWYSCGSEGYEDGAKANYRIIDDILVEKKMRSKIARKIEVSDTALEHCKKTGRISEYIVAEFEKLFGLNREFFNGKRKLTDEAIERINQVVQNVKDGTYETEDSLIVVLEEIRNYDKYELNELERIQTLLQKNLKIVTSMIEYKSSLDKK